MHAAVLRRRRPRSGKGRAACSPLSEAIRRLSRACTKGAVASASLRAYAYRVRNAIGKSHKLNCVLGFLPFWPQRKYEVESRVVRVGVVVVLRYVPEGIVWRLCFTHNDT
jgi:hypothetical protein